MLVHLSEHKQRGNWLILPRAGVRRYIRSHFMPVIISWPQILLRLFFTVIAGVTIGLNRGEHGRPAGLRTTLLVCLAASISMIQANLLMNTIGRAHDSFIELDLM